MHILMVIPEVFYSVRGTPLSAYHRICDLKALGHEVEVLTYPVGNDPPDTDLTVYRSFGPHFSNSLKQGPSYLKIWFDFWILMGLVWRLFRTRYDLIYAHEEGAFIAGLIAPLFGIPLVYDLHSSLPLQIRDWGFSNFDWVVSLFRWVERFSLKRAKVAVSISPAVAEAARASYAHTPVITILNRFPVECVATAEQTKGLRSTLGIGPESSMILYTGSFVALQALDLLVESIPIVAEKAPEVRFVLVGGRPAEIEQIGLIADSVGANSHLQLLPFRPEEEMPIFTAAADVLVSPRIHGINPPGKLFSYLNSGRPVVATNCLVHNQILDESCAILTEPNPEGLAQGILLALHNRELVDRITRGAERLISANYSPISRAENYEKLFRILKDNA